MRWLDKLLGEKKLFLTHTAAAYKIGDKVDYPYEGNKITRIIETSPTALQGGGRAACWEVWGKHL